MIDRNGKLFGKISIVDLFALLLVITVIAGSFYKFNSPKTDIKAGQKELSYTLLIKGVRDFTYEYYTEGLKCYDKKTKEEIGTIVGVRQEPYKERVFLKDGTVSYAEKPGAINVYLDIETDGTETANAFYAKGTYELKAGSEINLSTQYIEVFSTVYEVSSK